MLAERRLERETNNERIKDRIGKITDNPWQGEIFAHFSIFNFAQKI